MRTGYAQLKYNEVVTLVDVRSTGYRGSKVVNAQIEVPAIFLQATGVARGTFADNIDADAVCYLDPSNWFIISKADRIEGMYIIATMFDGSADASWYKIEKCTINRDHLLSNEIDNVECLLIKSEKLATVS